MISPLYICALHIQVMECMCVYMVDDLRHAAVPGTLMLSFEMKLRSTGAQHRIGAS